MTRRKKHLTAQAWVRMTPEMKAEIDRRAEEERRDISEIIRHLLEQALAEDDTAQKEGA